MYIKFLDAITPTECAVKQIAPNIVELKFADEIIVDTSGFNAYLDKECEYDIGGNSYVGFTTVYRNDETTVARNGYQLSNDGSVYTPPIPVVTFNTNGGGTLDGITEQQLTKYEQLKVPTPIANEDYEFSYWSPSIPESGKIESNRTFTAIFTSTLPPEPEPEPQPDLTDRVLTLEEDVKKINEALGGN
jgi:hypothetical protein